MKSPDHLAPTVANFVRRLGLRPDAFQEDLDLAGQWQWIVLPATQDEDPTDLPRPPDDVLGQILLTDSNTGDGEVFITVPNTPLPVFEIAESMIIWDGSHTPSLRPRIEDSECIAVFDSDAPERLATAVKMMKDRRVARYRTCRECGGSMAPEHFIEHDLCHGCAQENHGVVF